MKPKSIFLIAMLFANSMLFSQNIKNGRAATSMPGSPLKIERIKLEKPVYLTDRTRDTKAGVHFFTGHVAIGDNVNSTEDLNMRTLMLKEPDIRIRFEDTDGSASGYSYTDWQIQINSEAVNGDNFFAILDETYGESPFKIMGGAFENSVFISDNGNVGIGSNNPQTKLHVETDDSPTLSLNQNNLGGWATYSWDIGANDENFFIRDVNNANALPFRIIPGAPTNSLYVNSGGYIGLGTNAPFEKLHVEGSLFVSEALKLNALSSAPSGAVIGDVYMDANTKLLKYYNGTQWIAASAVSQTLSLSSNNLSISNGNSVNLSAYLDNTDDQNLTSATLTGTVLKIQIENGTSVSVNLQPLISNLENRVAALEAQLGRENVSYTNAKLFQNVPNPYTQSTSIAYFIPEEVGEAYIQITDIQGRIVNEIQITERGSGMIELSENQTGTGTFFYNLILDNEKLDSKIMIKMD